jgi:hypothetical protein
MVHNARAASFDRILTGTKWISGDMDFGRRGETWISGGVDFDIDECGEEHNAYNHEDTSVWNMPANNANFD